MMAFSNKIDTLAKTAMRRRRKSNLTPQQHRLIRTLQADTRFKVCLTDKNLGPAILERETYIQRAFQDHLAHADTYQPLTEMEATRLMDDTASSLKDLITAQKHQLSPGEVTYFDRSYGPQ
jgi:hypothetical protein